ncbi:hypothetical protein ES708_34087 [subsurface metagenome]
MLTQQQVDEIVRLYCREQFPVVEVARQLGIGRNQCYGCLRRLNLVRNYKDAKLLAVRVGRDGGTRYDIEDEQVRRMYAEERMSIREVAYVLDCSGGSVAYRVRRLGISRSRGQAIANFTRKRREKTGGKFIDGNGYVWVWCPEDERAHNGYMREHWLVWERANGRRLPKGWLVHHLNGNKQDNVPGNLVAMSKKKHRLVIPLMQRRIRFLETVNKNLLILQEIQEVGSEQ